MKKSFKKHFCKLELNKHQKQFTSFMCYNLTLMGIFNIRLLLNVDHVYKSFNSKILSSFELLVHEFNAPFINVHPFII